MYHDSSPKGNKSLTRWRTSLGFPKTWQSIIAFRKWSMHVSGLASSVANNPRQMSFETIINSWKDKYKLCKGRMTKFIQYHGCIQHGVLIWHGFSIALYTGSLHQYRRPRILSEKILKSRMLDSKHYKLYEPQYSTNYYSISTYNVNGSLHRQNPLRTRHLSAHPKTGWSTTFSTTLNNFYHVGKLNCLLMRVERRRKN